MRLLAPLVAAINSLSLGCSTRKSLFRARWMRNTIRNVMMVVPVLMTSCQVSEYLNRGPVAAYSSIIPTEVTKAAVEPVNLVMVPANRPKKECFSLIGW